MPHFTQLPQRGRAALSRYLRARAEDVLGRSGAPRPARVWLDQLLADLNERPAGGAERRASTPPATWATAVARAGLTASGLRRRHEADAFLARALLSAAVVSGLIGAHRCGLADAAGASASLGMTFTLAGLALGPAYRCWRIRARRLGALRWFLRHPAVWWPYPLPDDYQP